jgi:response regulator RpfG family c-di-GMP phosphodiesterase
VKVILFVDQEESMRELSILELEGRLDVRVIEENSGHEAINYMKGKPDIDAIVCDYDMPGGNGSAVYDHVKNYGPLDFGREIPFVFFTGRNIRDLKTLRGFPDINVDRYLQKPFDFKKLAPTLKDILYRPSKDEDVTTRDFKETPFCKIGIKRFAKINYYNCDIYIRLSETKFIKIFKKDELIEVSQLDKYAKKGVDFLYVNPEDFEKLAAHYARILKAELANIHLSIKERALTEVDGIQFVHETIQEFGITPAVVDTTNVIVESIMQMLKSHPSMLKMLTQMMNDKDYIYEHSLIMSYFGNMLVSELNWSNSSTLEKIVTASLMHDLCLEDAKLALVDSLDADSIQRHSLSKPQVELIKQHPHQMAMQIRALNKFPPEVDQMIMDHHEKINGTGFPRGVKHTYLSQMTTILLITEDFVNAIYNKHMTHDLIKEVTTDIYNKYNIGHLKKTADAFLRVIAHNNIR